MICPSIKPPKISWNSGSSRRNASCPLSLLTSTKLTFALDVFKDFMIVFVSEVGNNQSDVKVKKQKDNSLFLNALVNPPFLNERSKKSFALVIYRLLVESNLSTNELPWCFK